MEPHREVRLFRTRKLIAWAILLVGVVAGMVVGFVVMEWVWPAISTDRPISRAWWNEQGWTLAIGILTVFLVIIPFAWIGGLIEPESPSDDKKSEQPADADH
jgi:xanthosine utilization system XapX-like protein